MSLKKLFEQGYTMKVHRSTACVIITLCIFATCSAKGNCHHDKGSPGQVEARNENQAHKICCNGRAVSGTGTVGSSEYVFYCCGSKAYNPLNEICCEDTILIRQSANTKCCGKDQYQTDTHKCCGNGKLIDQNGEDCCGKTTFDKTTHCCCSNITLQVEPKDNPCCQTKTDSRKNTESQPSALSSKHHQVSGLECEPYDPQISICCLGNLYKRSSELTKCCGGRIYSFSQRNVLCCNGKLYTDIPEKSECVGGVIFSPMNSTCHLPVRPRLGEHCCGGQSFDPRIHICCNGHRRNNKNGNFCCGSEVYDHRNKYLKCCSGRLYNTSKASTECCGNLLMEKNQDQTCCSSSTHAMYYVTKSNHSCCGHHYYNKSLWSCCAEHLKPTPEVNSNEQYRVKPLLDLIPGKCSETVFLGKVESMTLKTKSQRHVLLKVMWWVNCTFGTECEDTWLDVPLDHCSSPPLENGMTYLWEKNNTSRHNEYKLLSHPVNLTSDIQMFYFLCYNLKDHKKG